MGLEVPDDFSAGSYEAIHTRLTGGEYVSGEYVSLVENTVEDHIWSQYSGAWNALAYRFRSCAEHDEAFAASIRREASQTETYIQERELFGFFVTGWSAIESLFYALYAIGAMLNRQRFPIIRPEDMRAINPKNTASKFNKAFKSDPLTEVLRHTTSRQEYKDWKEIRNVLLHRIAPSRSHNIRIEIDGDPLTIEKAYTRGVSWWEGIPLDDTTTAARRKWLAATLVDVLKAAATFTAQRF